MPVTAAEHRERQPRAMQVVQDPHYVAHTAHSGEQRCAIDAIKLHFLTARRGEISLRGIVEARLSEQHPRSKPCHRKWLQQPAVRDCCRSWNPVVKAVVTTLDQETVSVACGHCTSFRELICRETIRPPYYSLLAYKLSMAACLRPGFKLMRQ
jgi:hypothetical protein